MKKHEIMKNQDNSTVTKCELCLKYIPKANLMSHQKFKTHYMILIH